MRTLAKELSRNIAVWIVGVTALYAAATIYVIQGNTVGENTSTMLLLGFISANVVLNLIQAGLIRLSGESCILNLIAASTWVFTALIVANHDALVVIMYYVLKGGA